MLFVMKSFLPLPNLDKVCHSHERWFKERGQAWDKEEGEARAEGMWPWKASGGENGLRSHMREHHGHLSVGCGLSRGQNRLCLDVKG